MVEKTKNENVKAGEENLETVEDDKKQQKDIDIEGMTCGSCAQAVEKNLAGLEGTEGVNVNLATD